MAIQPKQANPLPSCDRLTGWGRGSLARCLCRICLALFAHALPACILLACAAERCQVCPANTFCVDALDWEL